jgi:hypothetical protein
MDLILTEDRMSRLPIASNVLLLLASSLSFAVEPQALTVVWHDTGRIFPAVGLPRLSREMEGLFKENQLPVRFHAAAANEDLMRIPEPRVNVIVLPEERGRFHVGPDTMAAVLGERGEKSTIFLFYSGVRRTLGHKSDTSPRELAELTRALARVVAHEVVHVLAPERGHAEAGLMSRALEKADLLSDRLALDECSLPIARENLGDLVGSPPLAMFQISMKPPSPFE